MELLNDAPVFLLLDEILLHEGRHGAFPSFEGIRDEISLEELVQLYFLALGVANVRSDLVEYFPGNEAGGGTFRSFVCRS